MEYICINKTLIEERIKELKEKNYDILSTRKAYEAELIDTQKLILLEDLLTNSINAEEVFNAGRENCHSAVMFTVLGLEVIYNYDYENYKEFTKTLTK
jgi:hypothetical protein